MHAWLQSIGMIVEGSVVRVVVFAVVVDTTGCVVFSDVCGRGVVVGVNISCVVLVTVESVTGVVGAEVVSREAVVSALALVVVDAEELEAGVV